MKGAINEHHEINGQTIPRPCMEDTWPTTAARLHTMHGRHVNKQDPSPPEMKL